MRSLQLHCLWHLTCTTPDVYAKAITASSGCSLSKYCFVSLPKHPLTTFVPSAVIVTFGKQSKDFLTNMSFILLPIIQSSYMHLQITSCSEGLLTNITLVISCTLILIWVGNRWSRCWRWGERTKSTSWLSIGPWLLTRFIVFAQHCRYTFCW